MQMYWTEPLEWNRVKAIAKEVSRAYHWKMMCTVSIALFFVLSLVVRWGMPLTAEFLTCPRILLGVLVVTVFALVPFLQSFQSGSVIFRRKWLDVSDSFVHVFLPYETIEWIRFERYQGKTYFAVKGLSRQSQKAFEVRVALTAKYSESDITAYLVQRGLGGRLQVTRDASVLPIRTESPKNPYETQQTILFACRFLGALVGLAALALAGFNPSGSWYSLVLVGVWAGEFSFWQWLLRKGSGRKDDDMVNGKSVGKTLLLGIPCVLTLALNPVVVFALMWALKYTWGWSLGCAVVWQIVWAYAVYVIGRWFR